MLDLFLYGLSPKSKSSPTVITFLLLIVIFFAPASCLGQQDDFRTWKDTSGKFSIEAKFVSEEDGNVKLEKRDGTTISIPREKLSRTDQDFLKGGDSKGTAPPTAKPGLKEVSTGDVRMLEIDRSPGWNLPPQLAAENADSTNEVIEIPWWDKSAKVEIQKMQFVRTAVVRNPRSPNWLMYAVGGVGGPVDSGFYDGMAFDMLANKSVGKFNGVPFSPLSNALDDKATQMLCVDQDRFSRDYSVNLFQLDGNKIRQRAVLFIGKDRFLEFSQDHPVVQFAGAEHYLVSASQFGKVLTGCCSVTHGSLDWMVEHDKGSVPFVTPDGKTMIVHVDGGLAAFEIESGKQSAWIASKEPGRGTISLSPDGTSLLEAGVGVITVRDFLNGQMLSRFSIYRDSTISMRNDAPPEIHWLNDHRLALISRTRFEDFIAVVDIELQSTLCNYRIHPNFQCSVDMSGRLRYLVPDPPNLVWQSISLPHAEAEQEIENNLRDMVRMDRSVPVSISVDYEVGLTTHFVLEREQSQGKWQSYTFKENVDLSSDVWEIIAEKFRQSGYGVIENGQAALNIQTSPGNNEGSAQFRRQPPVNRDIVFGQGPKGGTGAGAALDMGSSRETFEPPKSTPVSRLPDDALITGSGYSMKSSPGHLEFEGVPMWTPQPNWSVARKKRDDTAESGFVHLSPEEIVLQMFRDIDVPQVFVRPRELPMFKITEEGIKHVKDSSEGKRP